MDRDLYYAVKNWVDDVVCIKGYKIDDIDSFYRLIINKIPKDKYDEVIGGEYGEELEDLIDYEYKKEIMVVNDNDVLNYIVKLMLDSPYTFGAGNGKNIEELRKIARMLMKYKISLDRYKSIVLAECDQMLSKLIMINSNEFKEYRDESYQILMINYEDEMGGYLFTASIINSVISNVATIMLEAENNGIDLDIYTVVKEVVDDIVYKKHDKRHRENFGFQDIKNAFFDKKLTGKEIALIGSLMVGFSVDLALTPVAYPTILKIIQKAQNRDNNKGR